MYLLAWLAAIFLLGLLILEGQSFFSTKPSDPSTTSPAPRPRHKRWFGGLTLFIAVPIALLQVLLLSRTLIYSPEFGAFIVQGAWARYVLEAALATIAIAAALLWHAAILVEQPQAGVGGLLLRLAAGCIV